MVPLTGTVIASEYSAFSNMARQEGYQGAYWRIERT